MEAISDAEIGQCFCHNTVCARAIPGLPNQPIIPIRDLVMSFPDHGWSIMIPCKGNSASWSAIPSIFDNELSPFGKIVHCSNNKYKWIIKLDYIPDFFFKSKNINDLISSIEDLLPFV